MSRVAIIGAGAWGTSLSMVLGPEENSSGPPLGKRAGRLRKHYAAPRQRTIFAGLHAARFHSGDERSHQRPRSCGDRGQRYAFTTLPRAVFAHGAQPPS